MMRLLLKLRRNTRGASVVEMALIAPALFTFIIAIANLGILFFAHSCLKSALAEGARYASIYPKPSNALIAARVTERRFGLNPAGITAPPTVTDCEFGGRPCVDISMSYKVKMNLVFFQGFDWSTFDFTEKRRAFVYPASISSGSGTPAPAPTSSPTPTPTPTTSPTTTPTTSPTTTPTTRPQCPPMPSGKPRKHC